jgi:spermidine synthase
MSIDFDKAEGRCLVLGLGLGYYPYIISQSDKVKSITIVELNEKIIILFEKYILPQFEHKEKIRIVHADAIEYMKSVERDEYDFCYADIWEGQVDGAPLYLQIKKNESRLPYTRFAYWIEEEIKWYIDNMM